MRVLVPVRALAALACCAAADWSAPTPGAGQTVVGLVAEQVTLDPVEGAVVTIYRVVGVDSLEATGLTTTDPDGAFTFAVARPGRYRVQADLNGLSSPLSGDLDLADPDARDDVALLLPSVLLRQALTCRVEHGDDHAAVVGVLRDADAGVAVPGASLTASWRADGRVHRLESRTDAAGRYRFCPPGEAETVGIESLLLGRLVVHPGVAVKAGAVVLHDLELTLASGADTRADVITQERIALEVAARSLGDLRGGITDRDSGRPLAHAVVRLEGTPHQVVTDTAGMFAFAGLAPGAYRVEVRSLGYEARTAPVEVAAGEAVLLRMGVGAQALEIDGLEVTARSEADRAARTAPFRRDIVYGQAMAIEEQRGARAFEALRRAAPGIRVSQWWREGSPPVLCIQTNRRVQSLMGARSDEPPDLGAQHTQCANAQVVVDGVRVPDGPEFLMRTPAAEIESIEFLTPLQAQTTYGIGGDTANGVVVVYTRGRGPYASPLRNRTPS